jgi:hypothetical protein
VQADYMDGKPEVTDWNDYRMLDESIVLATKSMADKGINLHILQDNKVLQIAIRIQS